MKNEDEKAGGQEEKDDKEEGIRERMIRKQNKGITSKKGGTEEENDNKEKDRDKGRITRMIKVTRKK